MRQFCIILMLFQATALVAIAHPHSKTTPKQLVRAEPRTRSVQLKVTGLISSSSGLKVILKAGKGSRIMRVGECAGELKVLSIDTSSVTLLYRGEEHRISLQH